MTTIASAVCGVALVALAGRAWAGVGDASATTSDAAVGAASVSPAKPPPAKGTSDVAAAAQLPVCKLSPTDPEKLAVEPCRRAPPPKRRAVSQTIGRVSFASAPTQVYGFRPAAPTAVAVPAPSTAPTGPIPVNSCDAGGCYDTSAVRHEGGVGNATLGPAGTLCNRYGVWLQCD